MIREDRFLSKVDVRGPVVRDGLTPCRLWTGAKTTNGYGQFYWGDGRHIGAHRAAWQLAHGPISDESHVLHLCDNKACVNPEHLRLGTPLENAADYSARIRERPQFGVDVVEWLCSAGFSHRAVAKRLGMAHATVSRIIKRLGVVSQGCLSRA